MAHNVETMAYSGQLPWHGLGIEVPDNLRQSVDHMTFPAQAMPPEYQRDDSAVAAYRAYYRGAKSTLLTFTRRRPPEWLADVATFKEIAYA